MFNAMRFLSTKIAIDKVKGPLSVTLKRLGILEFCSVQWDSLVPSSNLGYQV